MAIGAGGVFNLDLDLDLVLDLTLRESWVPRVATQRGQQRATVKDELSSPA